MNLPDYEAPLVGGPFDGQIEYFNPNNWEHNETRYKKLYDLGIIEPITVFSKNFPEGAIYSWDSVKRQWKYEGLPSEKQQVDFRKFIGFFGIEPNQPL